MIKGKRYITINTDAGVHPSGKGCFAFWIKTDEKTIKQSGVFKEDPVDSTHAEMMSIVNALSRAKIDGLLDTSDIIVINTDSKGAIHAFQSHPHNVKQRYKSTRWAFIELIRTTKQSVTFKHVKAHSPSKGPREHINNWCDTELKKHYKKFKPVKEDEKRRSGVV